MYVRWAAMEEHSVAVRRPPSKRVAAARVASAASSSSQTAPPPVLLRKRSRQTTSVASDDGDDTDVGSADDTAGGDAAIVSADDDDGDDDVDDAKEDSGDESSTTSRQSRASGSRSQKKKPKTAAAAAATSDTSRLKRQWTALCGSLRQLPSASFHQLMWACGAGEVYYPSLAQPSLFAICQRGYASSLPGQRRAQAARVKADEGKNAVGAPDAAKRRPVVKGDKAAPRLAANEGKAASRLVAAAKESKAASRLVAAAKEGKAKPRLVAAAKEGKAAPRIVAAAKEDKAKPQRKSKAKSAAATAKENASVAAFASGVDEWDADVGGQVILFIKSWEEADTQAKPKGPLRDRVMAAFRHRLTVDPSLEDYGILLKRTLSRSRTFRLGARPVGPEKEQKDCKWVESARAASAAAYTRFRPGQLVVLAAGNDGGWSEQTVVALAKLVAVAESPGGAQPFAREEVAAATRPNGAQLIARGDRGARAAAPPRETSPALPSQPCLSLPLPDVPFMRHSRMFHTSDPRADGTRRYRPPLARMRVHVLYAKSPFASHYGNTIVPREQIRNVDERLDDGRAGLLRSCPISSALVSLPVWLEYAQTEIVDRECGDRMGSHGTWVVSCSGRSAMSWALTDDLWLNTTDKNLREWVVGINERREVHLQSPASYTFAFSEPPRYQEFANARSTTGAPNDGRDGGGGEDDHDDDELPKEGVAATLQRRADHAKAMARPEAGLWFPAAQGLPQLGTVWLDEATWFEEEALLLETLGAAGFPRVLHDLVRQYTGARYLRAKEERYRELQDLFSNFCALRVEHAHQLSSLQVA